MLTHTLMPRKSLFIASAIALLANVACGSRNMSFDLLSESASFNQSSAEVNGKIDILWVIDNSGSMDTSHSYELPTFYREVSTKWF